MQKEQKVWKAKRRIDRQLEREESLDQQTIWKIERCQRDYDNLQDDIMLASIYDEMARIDHLLDELTIRLAELRKQGFVFAKGLEDQIDLFDNKWDQLYDKVEERANRERPRLIREGDRVHRYV